MKSNEKNRVVTLDGPAGAGKTTMARYLASALDGVAYLDTGAIYRTIALAAKRAGFVSNDVTDEMVRTIEYAAPDIRIVKDGNGGFRQDMYLLGLPVEDKDLRTGDISEASSAISTDPRIRAIANKLSYRALGDYMLVVDGRDAGTAIFPDAELKFFLWASLEERANRRHAQELRTGRDRGIETIMSEMRVRDERDSTRKEDPLKYPRDAVWIDTGAFLEDGVKILLRDAVKARIDPDAARII